MPDTFPAALRRLREARGWTAYRLAKEAGVSQITVSRLESGQRTCTLPILLRLAEALGCTLDRLAGRVE